MPREPRCRRVSREPKVNLYKPQGISVNELLEVVLKVEELEALRLKDVLRLEQEECAQHMQVSRPTFQRILNEAHFKTAYALISGKAIRIQGGNYCLGQGYCRRQGRSLKEKEVCERQENRLLPHGLKIRNDLPPKIAVCSTGTSPSFLVDERFGRCACFMIWDPENKKYEVLANSGIEASHGAGTEATQGLIQRNVTVVIVQSIGTKAFLTLEQAGIKIYSGVTGKTVESALKSYQGGELEELFVPDK